MIKKNKRIFAFTLTELIVVIIVLGSIAGFAIPKYGTVVEKFRAKEGDNILMAILAQEISYKIDNDVYSNDLAKLGVEVETDEVKHFNTVDLNVSAAGAIIPDGPYSDIVASIKRKNNLYTLYIRLNGEILCGGYSKCLNLGYIVK